MRACAAADLAEGKGHVISAGQHEGLHSRSRGLSSFKKVGVWALVGLLEAPSDTQRVASFCELQGDCGSQR